MINFVQLNHKKDKDMIKLKELVIIISSMVIMSAQMNGQNVGIGANTFTPDNSALLELQSTNSGLLLPRMTTAQRDAISNPAQSLLIFNTTTKCFETYVDGQWNSIWCNGPCEGITAVTYDGVTYNTVSIGSQCWLKENLRTTKYNDGTSITNVTDNATWTSTTSGAYCCYDNNPSNCDTYGALYNWYAVNTGKLCPSGWHVPTDDDFKTLEMYLGMTQAQADTIEWRGTDQGSKLAGNAGLWTDGALVQNPNFGTSGFSALPGGYRYSTFYSIGNYSCLWTNTEFGISAWYRKIEPDKIKIFRNSHNKEGGFSVRCIRD